MFIQKSQQNPKHTTPFLLPFLLRFAPNQHLHQITLIFLKQSKAKAANHLSHHFLITSFHFLLYIISDAIFLCALLQNKKKNCIELKLYGLHVFSLSFFPSHQVIITAPAPPSERLKHPFFLLPLSFSSMPS